MHFVSKREYENLVCRQQIILSEPGGGSGGGGCNGGGDDGHVSRAQGRRWTKRVTILVLI